MTASAGLLDFFILEASDYLERLDGLLLSATSAGPDAESFTKFARALRGSAMMVKLNTMAELAASVERIGRGLRDGQLRWDQRIGGALIAAVDDLKTLLRAVRTWGSAEERRAAARIAELAGFAPAATRSGVTPAMAQSSTAFLAVTTGEIAAAVENLAARPNSAEDLGNALGRIRAIRGVAAMKDLPPLAEIVESVERATKRAELGQATLGAPEIELLASAAAALRRAAQEIRSFGRPDPNAPEVQRFAAAAAALDDMGSEADRIVPIADLYYADQGPHVVTQAPAPPTTPGDRFRLEVVSQAEHLRRLVGDAAAAGDMATRSRLARELRAAMRALRAGAESFNEREVAGFVDAFADAVVSLDMLALSALDEVSSLLAAPSIARDELARRLQELARGRSRDQQLAVGLSRTSERPPELAATDPRLKDLFRGQAAVAASMPSFNTPAAPQPAQPSSGPRSLTPTGKDLQDALSSSIAGLQALDQSPLSQPAAIEDQVVPIEWLLYRGKAALRRALELRDEIKTRGAMPEMLDELFDLLSLATQ